MRLAPRLLNNENAEPLPKSLFSDLQLDKVLSAQAIEVLRHPCRALTISRRNALFALLEEEKNATRIADLLSLLRAAERALHLWQDAKIPLERYYRYLDVLRAYEEACTSLSATCDLGELFAEVAAYFSSAEMQQLLSDVRASVQKVTALLASMQSGLLSFSDKCWLTPDGDAESDWRLVCAYAETLGFSVPKRKNHNSKINASLSDAICRLHADAVAEIETTLASCADVDFYDPISYISDIKFFLEIRDLTRRAAKSGVKYGMAKIAQTPQYVAKELYDVSLLAKDCTSIVPNDADFTEREAFFFLIGANGGGKTTYLRALGINLLLFLGGCPVFAREAEIYPFDLVLSHFPKDERFDSVGRLDEERARAEQMLEEAHDKTAFLFFNETFSGTDDLRGFALLTDVVGRVSAGQFFGLYVTHFHEVMTLDYPVLSAEVDMAEENKRTFRIVKSKGSASSYAVDILKKYRLDKHSLEARRANDGN